MTPLLHNYTRKAGKTYSWDTSDSEENFKKNSSNPETKKILQDLGFLDRPIEYRFNSHGFRTHEFDQNFDIACFGCSFTMGTGLHAKDTWPTQLEELTGLRAANLGHAGSSNDTMFRFAWHYLRYLRPRYAIWLQTDPHRFELMDQSNNVALNTVATDTTNPCSNDYFVKCWFASPDNWRLNLEKNTLAFQKICDQLGIKSIILDRDTVPDTYRYPYNDARDLVHPGANSYQRFAKNLVDLLDHQDSNLRITRAQMKLYDAAGYP